MVRHTINLAFTGDHMINKALSFSDGFTEFFVGFDKFFGDLESLTKTLPLRHSYPPHNIIKTNDGYKLELAVAGFADSDILISVENCVLSIAGNKDKVETEDPENLSTYIHRGVANRSFEKKFQMGDFLDIDSIDAKMEDGLLTVTVDKTKSVEPKTVKIKTNG